MALSVRSLIATSLLLQAAALGVEAQEISVFVAKKIVTLNPSQPEATAVAIRDGRFLSVGTLESLEPWLRGNAHRIDRRFEKRVLLPGLIDNHLHPNLAAIIVPMHWVTPHPWRLGAREVSALRGRDAFLERLRELDRELGGSDDWLFTWGYHHLFQGDVSRSDLDEISEKRPIVVWHRSFHEIFLNSAAIEAGGITRASVAGHAAVDLERGHFYETGLPVAISAISEHIMAPDRYLDGLRLTRDIIHAGGITTVVDMGAEVSENAWALLTSAWDNPETPFRTWVVPRNSGSEQDDPSAALGNVEDLVSKQGQRVRVLPRSVKFLADGAFYSQLMKMGPPGYIDGHHGEWLTEPDQLEAAVRPFWRAGYQIHVHANGDVGIDATLDILETMLEESPRPDHRFALHHYGYSTQAQARRVAKLGAVVSAQPFYLWALADTYAELGLGHDRAAQISRLGSLVREGVPVSLHSDFTMAPASPLTLAGVAVTRRSATGKLWAPQERLTKIEGLEAITIDAAYTVGLEDEIGSVEAGKKADLVVLAENPLDIDAGRWPDIEILATILEGVIFETQ